MYHGEVFCQVITEMEQFDEKGGSLGLKPVNPHIIVATRHGLRCSDRTSARAKDRALDLNIESFYCTANTDAPFEAAIADPDVGVIWYEEMTDDKA